MTQTLSELHTTLRDLRQEFDLSFAQAPHGQATHNEKFLAIRAGNDPYALRITEVAGLYADRHIAALPSPVPELIGLARFRGQIAPVYNLAALMGAAHQGTPHWLALLKSAEPLALAFNHFEAHFELAPEAIVAATDAQHMPACLQYAARIDGRVLPIIHLQSIYSDIQQRANPFVRQRSGLLWKRTGHSDKN